MLVHRKVSDDFARETSVSGDAGPLRFVADSVMLGSETGSVRLALTDRNDLGASVASLNIDSGDELNLADADANQRSSQTQPQHLKPRRASSPVQMKQSISSWAPTQTASPYAYDLQRIRSQSSLHNASSIMYPTDNDTRL
jgi:hypothetical protein